MTSRRQMRRSVSSGSPFRARGSVFSLALGLAAVPASYAQSYTGGFTNTPRTEAPGTLLSHPDDNDSRGSGRTTNLMIHGGWLMVGSEAPGSQPGADLEFRVYDIADPADPTRMFPSDFGLSHDHDRWHQGNWGYHTHGHYQTRLTLQPNPVHVTEFGGAVYRGNPDPEESQAWSGDGYNRGRGARQSPWGASDDWAYGDDADWHTVTKLLFDDTVGDWRGHRVTNFPIARYPGGRDGVRGFPIVFGDRLILLSDQRNSGLAIYRIPFDRLENADPESPIPEPALLGVLNEALGGYWPELYADGGRLYAVFTKSDNVQVADITDPSNPFIVRDFFLPGARNATYPKFQDNLLMIHDWVINMDRLIAGHPDPIDLKLNVEAVEETPQYPERLDTSQFSLPVGNLLVTGGYGGANGEGGMAIWLRQQEPDTQPPQIGFHIPRPNRANYPRHAPLSFVIHETLDNLRLDPSRDVTLRKVLAGETLGTPVDGLLVFGSGNVLTFTPHLPLDADSTYQVDFHSDPAAGLGLRDVAGNTIAPYSFRFSTGAGTGFDPAPTVENFTVSDTRIAPDASVQFAMTASDSGDTLEYRFNPGDGSGYSPWQSGSSFSASYAAPGRYTATLQVRDNSGNLVSRSARLLVIEPPSGTPPTQSSSIIVASDGRVWTVNPDADSVSVLDAATGAKLAEYPVGADPRSLAEDANGLIWVTCHDDDSLYLLNPTPTQPSQSVQQIIELAYGDAPFAVCPSPDRTTLYVSLYGSGRLVSIDAESFATDWVDLGPTPRAIAVNGAGDKVYVTRFLSDDIEAQVWRVNTNVGSLGGTRTIRIGLGLERDRGDRGAGLPNYLAGIAISPDGRHAVVSAKQDNVLRGLAYGTHDLTHETTVRAILVTLDLADEREVGNSYASRRDIDNSDSPTAVRFTPDGDALAVALQGNNQIVLLDALALDTPVIDITAVPLRAAVGKAPQGIAIDPATRRLFARDFMDRTVTILDAAELIDGARFDLPRIGATSVVAQEALNPEVLLGKQIFYNAADPRMSAESYISCATCHVDGGTDGRVWDFTGRGEGLRRTPSLRGRAGTAHGNVHWSGNFDEIQDFEHDIRGPFGGEGFIDDPDFEANHPGPASAKADLSPELDALAAYVASLDAASLPRSPHRAPDGSLDLAALAGKAIFNRMDCASCHTPDHFTNSPLTGVASPTLSNVGTTDGSSGQRLGQAPLTAVDVPTLLGLYENLRFLHHGAAAGLDEAFAYAGGPILEAEDATPVYGTDPDSLRLERKDTDEGGGGGWSIHGASGGAYMGARADSPAADTGVRFGPVDGGAGGAAVLRVKASYGRWNTSDLKIRVNGAETRAPALRTLIGSRFGIPRWQNFDIQLNPGTANTIEVLRPADIASGGLGIDAIMVVPPEQIAAAAPHQAVTRLSDIERRQLYAFLLSLDGSALPPGRVVLPTVTGTVNRDYWTDLPGVAVANLTGAAVYPGAPTGSDTLDRLEATDWNDPADNNTWADNYGQRVRGYIVPPGSADYTFWISGDDHCRFFLSTDHEPANAALVVEVDGFTSPYQFDKYASQRSVPITLRGGRAYYFELLHKEGGGGDHVAVAWTLSPDSIPGSSDVIGPGNLSAFNAPFPETADRTWLRNRIGPHALDDAPAHWIDDPDGDRILNLFEFLHGLDPGQADQGPPFHLQPGDTPGEIELHFTLVDERGAINVAAQASPDLETWTALPTGQWELVERAEGLSTWRIRIPTTDESKRFFRLWAD